MRILMAALLAGVLTLAGCGRDEVTVKLTVTAKGADGGAVAGANVTVGGRPVGATDRAGTIAVEERRLPGEEVPVTVEHGGARWHGSFVVRRHEGGEPDLVRLEARLARPKPAPERVASRPAPAEPPTRSAPAGAGRRAPAPRPRGERVLVRTLTDVFGSERPVAGVRVYLGDTLVGTTNAKGVTRVTLPPAGEATRIVLVADDFVPTRWTMEIGAKARRPREIRRFFYPVTPAPIRVGLAGYSASAGADPAVADGIARLRESLGDALFARKAFVEVPALDKKLAFVGLGLDDLAQRGWDGTPLRSQLDLLVVGSVAGPAEGPFTIETRVYTPSGRLLLAHVKEARDLKRPRDLTRDLAEEIVARFPFEGTVLEARDGRLRVNIGAGGGREIETGTRFHLFVAEADGEGRVTGRREVGLGTVTRVDELVSEIRPESAQATLQPGDRVVRALLDDPTVGATGAVRLVVRAEGDDEPVPAANVYVDGAWVGATGRDGGLTLPIRPRRKYDLLVFKHGFVQLRETVSFPQAGGERVLAIAPAVARFTVESAPSEAAVAVDGESVGRTPITEPVPVRLGFRRVRVDAGGDFRPMDRVIEFARAEVALVGPDRVVLEKDVLRIGERLLAEGRPDEAMAVLAQAGPKHPDFSAARHRLGQLYLDERKDPAAAIAEFEKVLSRPENRDLVQKRFAVVYTNLGHAYYVHGQQLARRDPEAAARAYRRAIEVLATARQNSRFFPSATYDEAVHDTYYYAALASHRLADLTRSGEAYRRAELAWRDYLDFFPRRLEGNPPFDKAREGGEQFYAEARRKAS
ncbi:MAG TPA: PEGA domain-containing protein [Thermodesulfobacteriota bacterium]